MIHPRHVNVHKKINSNARFKKDGIIILIACEYFLISNASWCSAVAIWQWVGFISYMSGDIYPFKMAARICSWALSHRSPWWGYPMRQLKNDPCFFSCDYFCFDLDCWFNRIGWDVAQFVSHINSAFYLLDEASWLLNYGDNNCCCCCCCSLHWRRQ